MNKTSLTIPVGKDGDLIDYQNEWHQIYQVTSTGAVLVRSDGHVAWLYKAIDAQWNQSALVDLLKTPFLHFKTLSA